MSRHPHARPPGRLAGTAALVAAGALVSACGSSAATTPADSTGGPSTGSANSGTMHVTGAYIPQPANTSVAAAYFTVADSGAADVLTGVTSDVSTDVGLHETVDEGAAGTMVAEPSLAVPAHGTVSFTPGGYHVMLMHPSALTVGQQVELTLHFAHAAPVSLKVPVVPLTGSDGLGSMPMGSMPMGSGS